MEGYTSKGPQEQLATSEHKHVFGKSLSQMLSISHRVVDAAHGQGALQQDCQQQGKRANKVGTSQCQSSWRRAGLGEVPGYRGQVEECDEQASSNQTSEEMKHESASELGQTVLGTAA